ncbi:hypothetical protein BsWGS_01686 [Bradybaena similaris]
MDDFFKIHLNTHVDGLYDELEKDCNQTVISQPPPTDGLYCPPLIDSWGLCFNYTKAGTIAYMPCPMFFPTTKAMSYRRCEENGTWEVFSNGKTWTNTSACVHSVTTLDESFHRSISYVHLYIAVASLSLVLLTVSLVIFCGFRQLRCDRITIHKNLFVSYILSALTWIIYYRLAISDGNVLIDNPVWCQLLNVIGQACVATNYSWMFCEGLYLHIIMAHALRTGKKLIKCLVVCGWVVPLVVTGIYGTVRWAASEDTLRCWMDEHVLQWIIAGPIVASVIINVCILVNLVRLLMTKLRQIPDAPQSRKATKATLILVPLLGLQYILFPVRPDVNSPWYTIYLHVIAFMQASQGWLVSVIFCFCNGEVRSLIRRKWLQHRLMSGSVRKNTGFTSSTFVDGYSVVDSTREGTSLRCVVTQDKNNEAEDVKGSPALTTPLVKKDPECTPNNENELVT